MKEAVETCPCCGQQIRTWKKALISTAVASLCNLVRMYRGVPLHHDDFTVSLKDRNFSQLRLWGLIEPGKNGNPDKRSAGTWRPTLKGKSFARGMERIPKYVVTQNNQVVDFEGPRVDVKEALNGRFSYLELMDLQTPAQRDIWSCLDPAQQVA